MTNRTPHVRTEHVKFGTDRDLISWDCRFMELPAGGIACAKVTVRENFSGFVDAIPDPIPGGNFAHHQGYVDALAAGLTYIFTVNGRDMVVPATAPIRTVVDHERIRIFHYRGRDTGSQGTFELMVDHYHGQPTARIQLAFDFEELAAHAGGVTLSFRIGGGSNAANHPVILYQGPGAPNANQAQLLGAAGRTMLDTGGVYWLGCIQFRDAAMLANADHAERITQRAQAVEPLMGVVRHNVWGYPWRVPVLSGHYTQVQYNNYANTPTRQNLPFTDPFGHLDLINGVYPGEQGEQPEFGARVHGITIGRTDSRNMYWEHLAAMRQRCRPCWYTEADGSQVKAVDHPQLRSWDEQPHYDASKSPDQLRRVNGQTQGNEGATDTAARWRPHRWQHTGWLLLQEDVLLNGNLMGLEMIRRVGEMFKVVWPDEVARALGRGAQFVTMAYGVTGDPSFVTGFAARVSNFYWTTWKGMSPTIAPYHPLTCLTGASHWPPTPPYTQRWYWMGWIDGLSIIGIDAILRTNLLTGLPLAQLTELRAGLIHAVIYFCYKPEPEIPCTVSPHMGATIGLNSFCDPDKVGGDPQCLPGGTPTPLPFVPTDYCDYTQAHGEQNTDYALWCVSAARCGRQLAIETNDSTMLARCNRIELASSPSQMSIRDFGLWSAWTWHSGPSEPGFDLARYLGAGVDAS